MVGVVGSSPIAPTNYGIALDDAELHVKQTERACVMTPRTCRSTDEHCRLVADVFRDAKKVRLSALFFRLIRHERNRHGPTCRNFPTVRQVISTRRSPSPRSPRRSAPALPRPRSPARSTASSSTRRIVIDHDATVAIVTDKDPEGLDVIRHSTAHLLAYAVKELFPDAQVTIGPVIENGFYYDFSYKRPFTPEDLAAIEKKMAELAKKDEPVTREVLPRDEAVAVLQVASASTTRPRSSRRSRRTRTISLYREGNFIDLCRGPHVPSTGKLKVFKLMKVAGAYWRGDSKNEMLQRIYGTAWAKKEDQDAYLHMLEEAEKRDHRKLGKQLDLFHLQDEAPGLVFWHPKGWAIWQQVEQYMRRVYQRQRLPGSAAARRSSTARCGRSPGHWENYQGQHVHHRVGEARLRGQADELPGPRADLQLRTAQLSRPAAALRRVRRVPPQRALGRAARHHARARLHAGRRPHLLHRGADPAGSASPSTSRRCDGLSRTSASPTSSIKIALRPDKRLGDGRDLGPGRERAARRA